MTGDSPDGSVPDPSSPKLDLVGPTVDDDIRRVIAKYGVEAVQKAVKRRARPKRGRPTENDWPELDGVLREDAHRWLEGHDPFVERTSYSIAKSFAKEHPGQSEVSTNRRIKRKLKKDRVYATLICAESMSKTRYPYAEHLRALRALAQTGRRSDVWEVLLHHSEGCVSDYTLKFGPPSATMPMMEIETKSRIALPVKPATGSGNILKDLFGARSG